MRAVFKLQHPKFGGMDGLLSGKTTLNIHGKILVQFFFFDGEEVYINPFFLFAYDPEACLFLEAMETANRLREANLH